jgi:NAD-dependent SIR2 family protein deacetylase
MDKQRLAVYCIRCDMWFDTKKGWQAKKSPPPYAVPICPSCAAPLMQLDYDEFIKHNREQGRLETVMTWEYPHGELWKKREAAQEAKQVNDEPRQS